MQCLHCQHENPTTAKFCLNCGTPLATVCPQCQHVLPASARFCMACGQALPTVPARHQPPDGHPPPARPPDTLGKPTGHSVGHSGVICGVHLAFALWLLGYPEQARQRSDAALTLAHALADPHSIAFALHGVCLLDRDLREGQAAQASAEALLELSRAHGFPYWALYGMVYQGLALAAQGLGSEGIAEARQGLATCLTSGGLRLVYRGL